MAKCKCVQLRAIGTPYVRTPQCDMPAPKLSTYARANSYPAFRDARAKRTGRDPKKCWFNSSHKIGSKYYCPKHAGQVALLILMSTKT